MDGEAELGLEPAQVNPMYLPDSLRKHPQFRKVSTALRNQLELGQLSLRLPLLNEYRIEKVDPDHSIRKVYEEYTTSVSTPIATISLELAFVIWFLLNKRRPKLIVDLGSGFSSYLFRLYQDTRKDSDDVCEVFSCDDNSFWLERTKLFLEAKGLSVEGLCMWDEFINEYQGKRPDLVLYDLGKPELRVKNMTRVFNLCNPETTLILDDIQKPRIKQAALDALQQRGGRGHDLARLTYDNFGRYAWMIDEVANASRNPSPGRPTKISQR